MPSVISRVEIGVDGPTIKFYMIDDQSEPQSIDLPSADENGLSIRRVYPQLIQEEIVPLSLEASSQNYSSFFRWEAPGIQRSREPQGKTLEEEFFGREGV